ncbi:LOW QUALITY PROTEIN: ankyrin repeat domain-containing protein 34A [Myotis lucifugus]|uniref:LOW QUALITY PROTEIN: ankyrin repeat domain-containing protein 34A n=1 Tax=Myotis lucifugus TaxID=59463 RepID=UPI0003C4B2BF|nr:LOW QUALITY PROTEIN: ankyrin repeat domain-containing protein 34A [Myotis lucifugus]
MLHTEGHALLRAVGQGKLRLARLLLEGGAYVNEGDAQGETALMAACRARYDDPQNKARMIRYLLEHGADPNIADRLGRTALMHACAGGGGAAVASLLLAHGADPSVRDHTGASALVHALDRGDRETLATLLDACKAKGTEVIIITTDTSPSGTKKTRQYLNSPPSPGVEDPAPAPPSPGVCASPSEIQLQTAGGARGLPSPRTQEEEEKRDVFEFPLPKPPEDPSPSEPLPKPPRHPPKPLKRLNSEPWGLVAPQPAPPAEGRLGMERLTADFNGLTLGGRPRLSRRHSTEGPEGPPPWVEKGTGGGALSRRNTAPEAQEAGPPSGLRARKLEPAMKPLGGSTSPTSPGRSGAPSLRRAGRYSAFPAGLLPLAGFGCPPRASSQESLPGAVSPLSGRRRSPGLLERRGSGTLLLDHISQTRPGFLPPLNVSPHPPIPDIRPQPGGRAPSLPAPPQAGAPGSPRTKRKLVRRHSMQNEQIRLLGGFQGLGGPGEPGR